MSKTKTKPKTKPPTPPTVEDEVTILARIFENGQASLSRELARYILDLGFSESDKARMHELAVRNQEGTISPVEQEELIAFVRAGDILALLKAKARRALNTQPQKTSVP
jgi:hypothetical protein